MEITITLANKTDIDTVSELFDGYRQFYRKSSDLAGANAFITDRLTQNDSIIFLAKEGNTGLGFVQLYPIFTSVRMGKLWLLNDLFVSENARKKGLGKLLMEKAVEFSEQSGAKGLMLQTEISNVNAQALYEKLGWIKDNECYYYNFDH
jgi:GNAT superfamily N-acetyltransferase